MFPPVDPATLAANPKFEALYRDLCENKLNSDGTSKFDAKTQHEREAFSKELHKARIETAKKSLVISGLQNLSYTPGALPDDLQELVAVVAALFEGQIPIEDQEVLQDDLTKFKENIDTISTALSKSIRQDTEDLAKVLDPENPPPIDNISDSVDKLQTEISTLESRTSKTRLEVVQEVSAVQSLYRQIIESSIHLLERTIHGSVSRGTKAKAEYLATVAEGMSKKLSVQEEQLLSQLYTAEFQEALRVRGEELGRDNRDLKKEIREMEEVLESYEKVPGMEEVAREYAEVLEETERVKAEIARLENGSRGGE